MSSRPSLQSRHPRDVSEWKAKKFLWVSLTVTAGSIIFFFAWKLVFPTIKKEASALQTWAERTKQLPWMQRVINGGGFTIREVNVELVSSSESDPALKMFVEPLEKIKTDLQTLKGESLLTVNLDQIQKNILDSGWIETVALRRVFPHSLSIRAIPRLPVFLVKTDRDWAVVDGEGRLMFQHPRVPGWLAHLPLVFGFESRFSTGLKGEEQTLKEAREIVEALEAKLHREIEAIHLTWDEWTGLSHFQLRWFENREGQRAEVGLILVSGQWQNRLTSLQSLLSEVSLKEGMVELDGRFSDRWLVRRGESFAGGKF